MAKRTMTRASMAKKTAFLASNATDARVVFGPFVLRPFNAGQFELYYSTKGCGATVEILDSDDETAINKAIDRFIAEANRLIARAA
jgi:hypothetical protein